jgi:hypothetical protein
MTSSVPFIFSFSKAGSFWGLAVSSFGVKFQWISKALACWVLFGDPNIIALEKLVDLTLCVACNSWNLVLKCVPLGHYLNFAQLLAAFTGYIVAYILQKLSSFLILVRMTHIPKLPAEVLFSSSLTRKTFFCVYWKLDRRVGLEISMYNRLMP